MKKKLKEYSFPVFVKKMYSSGAMVKKKDQGKGVVI